MFTSISAIPGARWRRSVDAANPVTLRVARYGHTDAMLGNGLVAVTGGWVASRTYTDTVVATVNF